MKVKRRFESWWDREAEQIHELCWAVSYPVANKKILHLHTRRKELTISREGGDPYWVGLSEQAWAMNRGLA